MRHYANAHNIRIKEYCSKASVDVPGRAKLKKPNDLQQQAPEGNTGYCQEEKVRTVEVSLHQDHATEKDLQQPSAWDVRVRMPKWSVHHRVLGYGERKYEWSAKHGRLELGWRRWVRRQRWTWRSPRLCKQFSPDMWEWSRRKISGYKAGAGSRERATRKWSSSSRLSI